MKLKAFLLSLTKVKPYLCTLVHRLGSIEVKPNQEKIRHFWELVFTGFRELQVGLFKDQILPSNSYETRKNGQLTKSPLPKV
jgi:hypothetical protein